MPHLLFRVSSSARPFRDDILSGLIVGRKGKRDTRKGCPKINTDDQLRPVAIRTLDLDSGVASRELGLRHARRNAMRHMLLWQAVPWRRVQRLLRSMLRVLHIGVDGGGMLDEGVLRIMGHWTRRTVRGRVAWRTAELVLWRWLTVAHGHSRRAAIRRRRGVGGRRDAVGGRDSDGVRSGGGGGLVLIAPERMEGLESGVHEVHVRQAPGRLGGWERRRRGK